MINTLEIYNELKENMEEKAAHNIAKYIGKMYEDLNNSVTKTEFNELKNVVQDLADAQKRTDDSVTKLSQKVEELAEAQRRTETKVEELAEAQKRTDDSVTKLTQKVEELAEAQRRTEIKVEELAVALKQTDDSVTKLYQKFEELAEAQKNTDISVAKLVKSVERLEEAHNNLAKQVGGLSETIGGDIEDIAYIALHRVLGEKLDWQVQELERTWVKWDNREVEIDVFGQAIDPKQPEKTIWIVGEAKHNLTLKEVEKFKHIVELARLNLEGEIFPVCFCYRARPVVQEAIKHEGFRLLFSYGKLI